ncbi:hypothetical protein E2562_018267 [Oryza meyeriana var. granulata]|uniref:Uncharacterized protein n=1 Tax=Oryza meyeriana var. granulata TaxID=110450 RepID=A0A6G1CR72_9ORYZ|nr:hypothetical protein E2562_018267 [Oryza meyeriana var. granulata]
MNMVLLPDGGRNPTFDEKFLLPLIEGLGELSILCGTATHSAMMTSLAAAGLWISTIPIW